MDHEPELTVEVHQEVPSRLGRPWSGRVRGDPTEMHPPGGDLDEEQHMETPEGRGVHTREVGRDDAFGLGADELRPGRSRPSWGRVDPSRSQNGPDRRRCDPIADATQFAMDASVPPGRDLGCETKREPADHRECWWSAPPGARRVGPVVGDESTVPADHGLGLDDQHDLSES
jgi:hypothetical protein